MNRTPKILLLCHNAMAMPALRYLHGEGVLAAIAVPDLYESVHQPFRALAQQLGIPFTTLGRNTYKQQLADLMGALLPDAVFVISFPWLIPVASLPGSPYGFLNFHGGLLPEMRGSDPIFHSIRSSLRMTGLTVHRMDEGMDTGPVIIEEKMEIGPETTNGMLSAQMAYAASNACGTLLRLMADGAPLPVSRQDDEKAVYLPKPITKDTFINWDTMAATEVKALVNACNPQLKGAAASLNGWKFGITHVTEINLTGDDGNIRPGTILYTDPQQGAIIYCKGGTGLRLDIISAEEGILPGYKLAMFGAVPGAQLANA